MGADSKRDGAACKENAIEWRLSVDRVARAAYTASMALRIIFGSLVIVWSWIAWDSFGAERLSGFFAGGVMAWSLIEYLVHRFVAHREWKSPFLHALITEPHRAHHAAPDDPATQTLPPSVALGVYILCIGVAYLITWDLLESGVIISGLTIGYLLYDHIHDTIHNRVPRTSMGRLLKRFHLIHHYADERRVFGVITAFWDFFFFTFPRHRAPMTLAKNSKK